MCHSNITNFPCHSCIVLFLFDLTDCSIGKSFDQFPPSFTEYRTFFRANFANLPRRLFTPGTFRTYLPNKKVAARRTSFSDTFYQKVYTCWILFSTSVCKNSFSVASLRGRSLLAGRGYNKKILSGFVPDRIFFRRTASPVPTRTAGFRLRGSAFLRLRCSPILLQSVRTPVC